MSYINKGFENDISLTTKLKEQRQQLIIESMNYSIKINEIVMYLQDTEFYELSWEQSDILNFELIEIREKIEDINENILEIIDEKDDILDDEQELDKILTEALNTEIDPVALRKSLIQSQIKPEVKTFSINHIDRNGFVLCEDENRVDYGERF